MSPHPSPPRFWIVSGTYLFLVLLAASLHTVHDHSWSTGLGELRNLFFMPAWICIPFLVMITKKLEEKHQGKELINTGTLFLILIFSVAGWFVLNMEQKQMDDLKEVEVVFLVFKITSLCVSIALLVLAYVFLNKKAALVLLVVELIFWTLKTLAIYPASSDLIFNGYFMVICCSLRLVLITKLAMKSKMPPALSA